MNAESKIVATERLRREGRWEAASVYRDEQRRQLRLAGKKRSEASEASWQAMLELFPPLPRDESVEPEVNNNFDELDLGALREKASGSPPNLARDAEWVYSNLEDSRACPSDAPSLGAWGLLKWARQDRQRFFEQVLPKTLLSRGKPEDTREQQLKQEEDARLNELDEMIADRERRRLHDTPDQIKQHCRDCVLEWQRKRGLNLPIDAADNLALEVAHFVDNYVQAGIKWPNEYRRPQ